MPSQLSARLETRRDLVDAVRGADRILMPALLERSQTARALWDLDPDDRGRDKLMLVLTDPWGTAAGDFAPDELLNEGQFQRRVHELVGEMIVPRRAAETRVMIELRDAFVSTSQLEQFRQALGQIPNIKQARLRLRNQVRLVPQRPENYLLTDFAIEVNEPFAAAVREAAAACGLQLRDDPWLIRRDGVREALLRLVDQHRCDGQPRPDFALCFLLYDRETLHLLEISDEAAALGDGNIDGVGFSGRGIVPYAHSLKLYLVHPDDLRVASETNSEHPLFDDLRNGNCEFLLPDDGGRRFVETFPELTRT